MAVLLNVLTGEPDRKALKSFSGGCDISNARVERARSIAPGHLRQRDGPDLAGMAGGTKLHKALAAEIAHRIHRGFKEFARIEFALALGRDFAECRGHRQPAVGVDIDLAHAMFDAADDLLDRHAPGLRHFTAEFIEGVLQRLWHRG